MIAERIAMVGFSLVIASVAAAGQQRDEISGAPTTPHQTVVVRTHPFGGMVPSRRLEIRTADAHHEVFTEIIETPDLDGRFRPSMETTTETVRSGADNAQITREVFGFGAAGERLLVEMSRSEQETLPDGATTIVQDTWAPDLNGRLSLTSRQVHHIQSIPDGIRATASGVLVPDINEGLRQSEILRQTERRAANLLRRDSTLFVRDANGRLQPTEMRSQEIRTDGADSLEEETIRRLDVNGDLMLSERNVIRRSVVGDEDRTTSETFSRNVNGLIESGHQPELTQRVRRTTTSAADGGVRTVEEVEERVPGSPSEPVRVVRRAVETRHKVDDERWESDLQVFELDLNGRFVLTTTERGRVGP